MNGRWRYLLNQLDRALVPRESPYFEREERELQAQLRKDCESGVAVPAAKAGHVGQVLTEILHDLLKHPLCAKLPRDPALFVHYDSSAVLSMCDNTIVVPASELSAEHINDQDRLRKIKAGIAHELGHIISGDREPRQRARDSREGMNQRMERRADLIAAYLCGDGGRALADRFREQLRLERALRPLVDNELTWSDRLANKLINGIGHRQYPRLEERVRYLDAWADRWDRHEPLPRIETLSRSSPHQR